MTTAQPFAFNMTCPTLFRSEGFAEDLCDSHPAPHGRPALRERAESAAARAVTASLFAALLIALFGCSAPEAARLTASVPDAAPQATGSEWGAPRAPLDTTPITPFESVGASHAE